MIKFDFSEFERAAKSLDAFVDQVPFALSLALNDAVEKTRTHLAEETWPSHIEARNSKFADAALTTKGTRATKRNLRVEIYDRLGRGNLALHDKGGRATSGKGVLAVPDRKILGSRGAKGMARNLRPSALKNTFRKGDVIYRRTGKYYKKGKKGFSSKGGRDQRGLQLLYTLVPSAPIKPDVPFHVEFERVMRQEVAKAFSVRIHEAMASRRPMR